MHWAEFDLVLAELHGRLTPGKESTTAGEGFKLQLNADLLSHHHSPKVAVLIILVYEGVFVQPDSGVNLARPGVGG